jgi:predicted NBD/HSP70 family sugar kinase
LGVAHPGRFLPDGSLARGTARNLGARPVTFDGARPAREMAKRLDIKVFVENDAVAQMRLGLALLLEDPPIRPQLLGETVIYLGPGTGLGGGVARIDPEGAVTTLTDGHLFDIRVSGFGGELLTAEELFSGPAVARLVAQANARLSTPITPAKGGQLSDLLASGKGRPEQLTQARRIADQAGDIFAAIIALVRRGEIVKVRLESSRKEIRRHVDEPERAWPKADKAAVRGVRRVIFGGWMGCDRPFGGLVRQRALEKLRAGGEADVEIFQIPMLSDDAGMLGASHAIPDGEIRKALEAAAAG